MAADPARSVEVGVKSSRFDRREKFETLLCEIFDCGFGFVVVDVRVLSFAFFFETRERAVHKVFDPDRLARALARKSQRKVQT